MKEPSPEPITIHAVAEPTRKRRGEAAEAAFLARATHLGFTVCLPWGDSERYDSVVDMGHAISSSPGQIRHRIRRASLPRQNRRSQRRPLHPRRNRFLRRLHRSRRYLVHHPHRSDRPPQRPPLLSQCPPPVSRPVRKIPRSLVSPGVFSQSPRLARHPTNMPPQDPPRPLRSLPKPVATDATTSPQPCTTSNRKMSQSPR